MRALRWFALMLVVGLLAGCAGLPTTSAVSARDAITAEPSEPGPNVEFYGPQGGESPVEIVRQFLRATGSVDEDYKVAREFLASTANRTWAPGAQVAINRGESDFITTQLSPTSVRLTATSVAGLDDTGHLIDYATPKQRTIDLSLAKVAGEWRISGLPADFGPYLTQTDFERIYTPYRVYLAETLTHTLVPDEQYFTAPGLPTALARAVLRGFPREQSDGSAQPAFNRVPSGTRLAVDAVPVAADGTASVDLTTGVMRADSPSRTGLWAAMMATLNQVSGVRRVELTVGGTRLDTASLPDAPVVPSDVGYELRTPSNDGVLTRTGDTLSWLDESANDEATHPLKNVPLPILSRNWYLLAASADGHQFAGVSGDRNSLGRWDRSTKVAVVPTFARLLTRPSFDDLGELWISGTALSNTGPNRTTSSGSGVWMVDTTAGQAARPQPISVPWLKDPQIVALRVAGDGQRVAVVTGDGKGKTTLQMSYVVRDANGQPTALSTPVVVSRTVYDVADVAWLDDVTLAVIGASVEKGSPQVIEVPLNGFPSSMGEVPGAQQIIGTGRGDSEVYVVTNRPSVIARVGSGWRTLPNTVGVVAPGA
ncbi:LpqB family beta-propeller domain-containing protein [Calidifontibacter terrae]